MSELGQTRSSERFRSTSAYAPQAEFQPAQYDVAEVPKGDLRRPSVSIAARTFSASSATWMEVDREMNRQSPGPYSCSWDTPRCRRPRSIIIDARERQSRTSWPSARRAQLRAP